MSEHNLETIYDVVIIGGGPAGSTAGIYAARANLSTLILDKGLTTGALGAPSGHAVSNRLSPLRIVRSPDVSTFTGSHNSVRHSDRAPF